VQRDQTNFLIVLSRRLRCCWAGHHPRTDFGQLVLWSTLCDQTQLHFERATFAAHWLRPVSTQPRRSERNIRPSSACLWPAGRSTDDLAPASNQAPASHRLAKPIRPGADQSRALEILELTNREMRRHATGGPAAFRLHVLCRRIIKAPRTISQIVNICNEIKLPAGPANETAPTG
jgi:hypothetical protein